MHYFRVKKKPLVASPPTTISTTTAVYSGKIHENPNIADEFTNNSFYSFYVSCFTDCSNTAKSTYISANR